jgi:hypothetical protein
MAVSLLVLFAECLQVLFAVGIKEFLATLLPRRFGFRRCKASRSDGCKYRNCTCPERRTRDLRHRIPVQCGAGRDSLMFPHSSKLAGPVKYSNPDPDTVLLTCDRSFKWPLAFALIGITAFVPVLFLRPLIIDSLMVGLPFLLFAVYFSLLRADVVLSKKSGTLELRPHFKPLRTKHRTVRLSFVEIREFLIESEFDLGIEGKSPFVWHLTAITVDGEHHRLTWHFTRASIIVAGEEAARITRKPLREQNDPYKSDTWNRWGYNFLP